MKTQELSKHSKYTDGNPISRGLVFNFFNNISKTIENLKFDSVLDCGCGEGLLLKFLEDKINNVKKISAIDIDPEEIKSAQKNIPFCEVSVGSVYDLKFADNLYDLVLCTEVLEHLEDPVKAMTEISRVSKKYVVFSVPREPIWRMMNVARLKYLNHLGNTPGHLNHWNVSSFEKFVSKYFVIQKKLTPLPWIILFCVKK